MNIRAKIFGSADEGQPLLPAKKPKGVRADELHSIPVEREEKRSANTRNQDRHRLVDEQVRLSHDGKPYDVQLVNLSGGGAMVSGAFEPLLWDKVELNLGSNGTIECAVLWIRDGRIGLEFAHETHLDCSADEQAELLREVVLRSFPDVAFEQREQAPEPEEHRRARRHPLIWSGVLHHDYQTDRVRVRNISATGAMIESRIPVRVGAEPVLELSDEASISAKVEWAIGDQVGLRFDKPFDLGLLASSHPQLAQDLAGAASGAGWDHATLSELHEELQGFLKR